MIYFRHMGEQQQMSKEDREFEFYAWEKQYGTEEAIRIAAEEWGISETQVKLLKQKWEDSIWL